MSIRKVKVVQDDDCHWYVIPMERDNEFEADCSNSELIDSGDFDDKWGMYRTGGDINQVELFANL